MKKITATLLAVGLCSTLFADQVISTNLIVQGSECIGVDCVNGENFSFDTLRLKENNLRINFDDTSSSASFPANDWTLTANDSANGGANKFSIDDVTGGKTPFTVEAGAPTNSLYVDDSGRIGIGTGAPVVQIHTVDGNTPTLRLEQDGSSGFSAQTWDVASNETNFFVRDVTNGSTLPFRIRPGAPTSSIDIAASGNVGIGTSSPTTKLDVQWSASDTANNHNLLAISVNNNGTGASDAGFSLENKETDFKWTFRTINSGEGFAASKVGTGGTEFEVDNTGANIASTVVKMGGVTVFESGHLVTASSRSLKTGIKPLDTQAALDAFHKLQPVSYAYKAHKDEPVVGFIAEDVPELVAMPSRKTFDSAEVVAVLTKVMQEQDKKMLMQDKILAETQIELKKAQEKITKLELMQKRLTKVESLLTNLALDTSNTTKEKVSLNSK